MVIIKNILPTLLVLAPGTFGAPVEDSTAGIFARGGNQCKTLPDVNSGCLSTIKSYSGYQNLPSKSKSGTWSCGYNHSCKNSQCKGENFKFPISQKDADTLLKNDLKPIQSCVAQYIRDDVKLNDNQFAALVSATYYHGCDSFKKSSLCNKLNKLSSKNTYNDVAKICESELPKWYSSSGKGSNQKKCAAEVALSKKSGQACLPCKTDSKAPTSPSKNSNDKSPSNNNQWANDNDKKDHVQQSDPKQNSGSNNPWGDDGDKKNNVQQNDPKQNGGSSNQWGNSGDKKDNVQQKDPKKDDDKHGYDNKDDGKRQDPKGPISSSQTGYDKKEDSKKDGKQQEGSKGTSSQNQGGDQWSTGTDKKDDGKKDSGHQTNDQNVSGGKSLNGGGW